MSAASCLLTEDQFLCSICLDVFTDPVSIPCGHNFYVNLYLNNIPMFIPHHMPSDHLT
uniref:Zinc finger RING-type eukaryotic domain-containing protein n=1 Tax=Sander lucioperca TaxID=283035 RepID=A0A8C9Z3D1_SANLU